MAVALNGHNGHNDHKINSYHQLGDNGDTEPTLKIVFDPKPDVKPCALRLGHGSWCNLPDGHSGEHRGATPQYGPVEKRPVLWRRHKGLNEK